MDIFLIVWIVATIVVVAGVIFISALEGDSGHDVAEAAVHSLLIMVAAPMLLPIAIIVMPFWLIYQLGKYLGKRKNG